MKISFPTGLEWNRLKTRGRNRGTSGSYQDGGDTGDKAFDGNIATYYDAAGPEESWTGLDFGENKKIASIHYTPRITGIGIHEGQEYELFCWVDNDWKSIEIKPATGQTIEFNAPRGALLYLRNNTIKRKGKVFFILNDKLFYYN